MKQKIQFLLMAACFLCTGLAFTSCGSDDDDDGIVPPPVEDVHQYVDLGLPSGLKWATCNVGADKPEAYGSYFAWGETQAKNDYTWATYKWGTEDELTKYCGDSNYGKDGFTDALTELELSDDAARANWGGQWRTPTKEDFAELIANTDNTWVADYEGTGVSGYKFTSNSDATKSIFLPAAGCRGGASSFGRGAEGDYWSRSLHSGYPGSAYYLDFSSGSVYVDYYGRYCGFAVRPVRP
ncbi:MAG: hypothetical protein J6M53_08400 [Bacteroidaceae bacterium]|nr:hypothetical protein [Bacteroidaceae bacterium]